MNNIIKKEKYIFFALCLNLILGTQVSSTKELYDQPLFPIKTKNHKFKPISQATTIENTLEEALANRLKFALEVVQHSMHLVTQEDKQALEEKYQQIKNKVNPILAKALISKIKQANLTINLEIAIQILVQRLNKEPKKKYAFKNKTNSIGLTTESIYHQMLNDVSIVLANKYIQILKTEKSESIILHNALDRALLFALEKVKESTLSMTPKARIALAEKYQQIKNKVNPLLVKEFLEEVKLNSNNTTIHSKIAIQILAQRLNKQPNKKYALDSLSLEKRYRQILKHTSILLEQTYIQILDRINRNVNLELKKR